jgi:hypothetical protein
MRRTETVVTPPTSHTLFIKNLTVTSVFSGISAVWCGQRTGLLTSCRQAPCSPFGPSATKTLTRRILLERFIRGFHALPLLD